MRDLDVRLLRGFLAVAEELHFTRAAERLYVAQQALSRDVQRLERELGVALFVRSTRRVGLTPAGERLLPRARRLLAEHDAIFEDLGGERRPLVVDVVYDGSTPARIVALARERSSDLAFVVRFGGGLGASLPALTDRRLDVAFGRAEGGTRISMSGLDRHVVRLEPLGLLVLDDDPLAQRPKVPLAALAGRTLDTSAGNVLAPEWVDAANQLARKAGVDALPPHPHVEGTEETARHLREHGCPILTFANSAGVPGGAVRPLVEPVPLFPWSLVHPGDLRHAGLDALRRAARDLGDEEGWWDLPEHWLPEPERSSLATESLP